MGEYASSERRQIAAYIAANGITECAPGKAWKLGNLGLVNSKGRRVLASQDWPRGVKWPRGVNGRGGKPDWLSQFISQAMSAPYLEAPEERDLIQRWQTEKHRPSLERALVAHYRLVIKMVRDHWGGNDRDLTQAGNLGLMEAVNRYDGKRGVRFATYARYWIRHRILEHLEKNQGIVKFATTPARKKLFYGLPRMKADLGIEDSAAMSLEDMERVAKQSGLPKKDIEAAELWRAGGTDELDDEVLELPSKEPSPEDIAGERERQSLAASIIMLALDKLSAAGRLNARDRAILVSRDLTDTPLTLAVLSKQHGISRERVRQIHCAAREKLKRTARGLLFQKANVPSQ